jgi:hypothetical protein
MYLIFSSYIRLLSNNRNRAGDMVKCNQLSSVLYALSDPVRLYLLFIIHKTIKACTNLMG